ncbi:ATP/GTP-binding protein [Streptomyces microflavus]|uniref:ATP/GTP-binding protein n=1 Tax=Streptomyces microflavus TaxID=1919 RepID=UPI002E32C125|nr:ATP/GTP-binding protein [Streptomyces microflavus]
MDDDGRHRVRGASGTEWGLAAPGPIRHPVPRPAGPPPTAPPRPVGPPPGGLTTARWLNTSRPAAAPGTWRYAFVPRPPQKPPRPSLLAPLLTLVLWLVAWVLLVNFRIPYMGDLLRLVTPGEWWDLSGLRISAPDIAYSLRTLYSQAFVIAAGLWAARLGNWAGLFRYYAGTDLRLYRWLASGFGAVLALWLVAVEVVPLADLFFAPMPSSWLQGGGNRNLAALVAYTIYALIALVVVWPIARAGRWHTALRDVREARAAAESPTPQALSSERGTGRALWPELRAAGQGTAADVLTSAVRDERMNDVDCARLSRAWESSWAHRDRSEEFSAEVVSRGPDAFLHPSGLRDLPLRAARHDLLTGQVRVGAYVDDERNPYDRRGTGTALEPAVLGTSLLAVGPSGAGKTTRLVRPVVETLALQALAGKTAVIAVCAAGTLLGADDAFDVVVKIGDASSAHDFDLYGGTNDPDEAAAVLAEGLVGDIPGLDSRRAALVLGQLLGPYRAVHGCFPPVPDLRELLAGTDSPLRELRRALEAGGHHAMLRELDARVRQTGSGGDLAPVLADRVALLDRPAFAGFFGTSGEARPFPLRSLVQHPLRVRIDLPERAHAGASRVLARLVLAQFNAVAAARTDRSLFACLVLDDATYTLTAETVRGVRHLRSVNAGAVLVLRTLDDVPEGLHSSLLGAVGNGMIFSGITTWDGKRFAEAWGKEWVEVRDVAQHTVFADQPLTRALHALRKLATGRAVTTEAVTVRQVERERWTASALAYEVPAGHAVLSLTTVDGSHTPPLLVNLGG